MGLTISGFYYVALDRFTGAIDALYFDQGSQPYQALRMRPISNRECVGRDDRALGEEWRKHETLSGVSEENGRVDGGGDNMEGVQDRDTRRYGSGRCVGWGEGSGDVGVRRWFPAVEFR